MAGQDSFSELWQSACDDYARETGVTLAESDGKFPNIGGLEDLSRQLDAEKDNFEDFRMKKRSVFHAMQTVLVPFESWGDLIVSAAFPPASAAMGAMMLLIQGARRVSQSFDMITDLFQKLGHFSMRLDSYKGVPLSEGMKTIIVKVLINVLRVCAASQKLLSRGSFKARLSKWAKNTFLEDTSISSLLDELEELTSQEHKTVSAHALNLTHQALRNTSELLERDSDRADRERISKVKAALNPVAASGQVFSSISNGRIPDSGSWVEERIQSWWQGPEPLLWIHGGPGVGKSYLASKIIGDLAKTESSATVASFFCKNHDVDLQLVNNALCTLAWQVVVEKPDFAVHAEQFCLKQDPRDNFVAWRKLLVDYFVRSDTTAYFIIDGIDELDMEQQDILFSLLEQTYAGEQEVPSIRFILLSRDSVRGMFEDHSLEGLPDIEVTNQQNKDDLSQHVKNTLQKSRVFRGSPDFRDEVVLQISEHAEGLWEWANLVIKSTLRCRTKEQIRKAVKSMPQGISAMLERELERLAQELSTPGVEEEEGAQMEQLNIVLSFVALAQKPFTVEQLEYILEVLLKEEVLNLEDDLRTVYSSFFLLRPAEDERETSSVVILRHTSFYEFFRTFVGKGLDPVKAEASFVYVILYVFRDNFAPQSRKWLVSMRRYADSFLPFHLSRADPEKAGHLKSEISDRFESLFTDDSRYSDWALQPAYVSSLVRYVQEATIFVEDVALHWWSAPDYETANQRAQLVLNWLLPDATKRLRDCAQSSAVASDNCAFTTLFAPMAVALARGWLLPEDIEDDGLASVVPSMLSVYTEMALSKRMSPMMPAHETMLSKFRLEPAQILSFAQLHQDQSSPIWHARLAQGQLEHYNYNESLEEFRIALDCHGREPSLSREALYIIHRGMANAYIMNDDLQEALTHSNLAQSLDSNGDSSKSLLNMAQMEHRAGLTEKAIATANRAWEICVKDPSPDQDDVSLFFNIFLELHQPQSLRPVLDFAFSQATKLSGYVENRPLDFANWFADLIIVYDRKMYRVLHYAVKESDGEYLGLFPSIYQSLEERFGDFFLAPEIRYNLALVQFEKGRISEALRSWYDIASVSEPPTEWHLEPSRMRTLTRMAVICLYHPEAAWAHEAPRILDETAEFGDICLLVSSWLLHHDEAEPARTALCGRVKNGIALLSDDDPDNDIDAFVMLFRTFLIATDNDEDIGAAVHLAKSCHKVADWDVSFWREKGRYNDKTWSNADIPTECSSCKIAINSILQTHFCRSCPYAAFCDRCYHQIRSSPPSSDDTFHTYPRGCSPEHNFYYTGPPLEPSEQVPNGMVPLVSPDGTREVIWIEEWKDRLAEKWNTADFAFEGGLHAWCMRVLPEEQRARWGTFFTG
ncbi:hypothetical protein BJX99DRAFT_224327 [Aspergillus californicus]